MRYFNFFHSYRNIFIKKNIEQLLNENQDIQQSLKKVLQEKKSLEQQKQDLIDKIENLKEQLAEKSSLQSFNNLNEIQMLSNLVLMFSKYKNNELEEKNRLIIEKYLTEGQNEYMKKLVSSLNQARELNFNLMNKLKQMVIFKLKVKAYKIL